MSEQEVVEVVVKKPETRGRKPINTDGSLRKGRYIRCTNCAQSFYYDYKNKENKPTPRRRPPQKKKKCLLDMVNKLTIDDDEELIVDDISPKDEVCSKVEQDKIDELMSASGLF